MNEYPQRAFTITSLEVESCREPRTLNAVNRILYVILKGHYLDYFEVVSYYRHQMHLEYDSCNICTERVTSFVR